MRVKLGRPLGAGETMVPAKLANSVPGPRIAWLRGLAEGGGSADKGVAGG